MNSLTSTQIEAINAFIRENKRSFSKGELLKADGTKVNTNTLNALVTKQILIHNGNYYIVDEARLNEINYYFKKENKKIMPEINYTKEKRDKMNEFLDSEEGKIAIPEDIRNYFKEAINKKGGILYDEYKDDIYIKINDKKEPVILKRKNQIFNNNSSDCNFLLEGDNYCALEKLKKTHTNKIDIIYIDPPYNTGNKEFVYNDKMIGEDDSYRHSKWLSFMENRLVIAKELLKDNGIIFISIDDNEQARLKLLCDNIFGEKNFVNIFHWVSNLKGRQLDGSGAAGTTEYILCYCKDKKNISTFTGSRNILNKIMPDIYKTDYVIQHDEYGDYVVKNQLYNTNSKFNESTRPNLVYDIYYNPNTKSILTHDVTDKNEYEAENYVKIAPHKNANGVNKYHAWRWSKEKVLSESYNLFFDQDRNHNWRVSTKVRDVDTASVKDFIMGIGAGVEDLKKLNLNTLFDYPKPIMLIKFLLTLHSNKDAIVLDFFAGSGTTGQAVLELNKEDGGNRKFILCTNNENNICENVTYQRLNTVITGIKKDGTKYSDGIPANLIYDIVDCTEDIFDDSIETAALKQMSAITVIKTEDELNAILDNVTTSPKTIYLDNSLGGINEDERQTLLLNGITILNDVNFD